MTNKALAVLLVGIDKYFDRSSIVFQSRRCDFFNYQLQFINKGTFLALAICLFAE